MPPEVTTRTPGAYIEQAFRSTQPEFNTGVPAFIGLVGASGSAGKAAETALFSLESVVRVEARSFAELEARAGSLWGGGRLGLAVRGFFQNGGSLCYLVNPPIGGLDKALDALSAVEDFDLVCAPDLNVVSSTASSFLADQVKLVDFCAQRGGCFAILDTVGSPAPSLAITPAALRGHKDSLASALSGIGGGANAAVYGPWLKVRGGCIKCNGSGTSIASGGVCVTCAGTGRGFIPPCGHVAGVYARTDKQIGVHKAPANETVEGAFDLQIPIDDATQGSINPSGSAWVNCVRGFPGRGIRIWGARTLTTDPAWSQVSVRRLILTIGRWLEQSTRSIAFEPSNFSLWVRMNRQVTAYLQDLFVRGALKGRTSKEAFFVKCDAETNPAEVRDAGMIITEVGVAPVLPNEFITVRLVSSVDGASAAVTT